MKPATAARLAFSALIALGLGSCGVDPVTTRTEPTKFLKSTGTDMTQRVQRLPFEHSWRDPKVDITKYKNIVVRPVTTSFLDTAKWEDSKSGFIPTKRAYVKRCAALARYWNKSLNKSFSSPICMYYKTTDSGQANTLILEIALTEVRFDRALPTAAGQPPVPAGSITSVVTGVPVCAFEARVRDAATGRLVSTAADRRGPELTVIDSDKNSFTRPNEKICDEWSDQLMKSSNIELFPKVRRSWFSLF
ncbi:MAG: DUF3313 family protein [Verrucomicrobiota bacterium]